MASTVPCQARYYALVQQRQCGHTSDFNVRVCLEFSVNMALCTASAIWFTNVSNKCISSGLLKRSCEEGITPMTPTEPAVPRKGRYSALAPISVDVVAPAGCSFMYTHCATPYSLASN